jgi:nucleotide sugar dehydrogenase
MTDDVTVRPVVATGERVVSGIDLDSTEIAVWGLGLIGYTLAGELAASGRHCLITDIDPERVTRLNRGELPFRHLPELAHDYGTEVAEGRMRATCDPGELLDADHPVHMLCVPTERDGGIDNTVLREVVRRIARDAAARPVFVLIESTIAPAWLDSVVHAEFAEAGRTHGVDYHVGSSPRRDWLTSKGHTMASIPKVIGGDTPQATSVMRELYRPACQDLLEARDARHAAMVKVVENYFRYRDIMFANELSALLPHYDVSSVLKLASSKWNMELYHPSLGIGGYCVPLAKDYLGQEPGMAEFAGELDTEEEKVFAAARSALRWHGRFQTVAVLGIAYAPGMKIHTRSPGVRLARQLADEGSTVLVHDPLYSPEEITRITGCRAMRFPQDIRICDSVLMMTDHELYRTLTTEELLSYLSPDSCVVDNLGTWSNREFPASVHYREVGGRGYFENAAADVHAAGQRPLAREFLDRASVPDVLDGAARVAAIDRRYLTVAVDGVETSMPELAALLSALRDRPVADWTDGQAETVCALFAVDKAAIRLEQVGITGDLGQVVTSLARQYEAYRSRLVAEGERLPAATGLPWWEMARALPGLRVRIDRTYLRLLELDGRTWYRAERFVPLAHTAATALPAPLADELAARYPSVGAAGFAEPDGYLRALAGAEIADSGSPVALLELLMRHATADPRHLSDHATLMCPRGTGIDHPGSLGKNDFGILVVFHPDFTPPRGGPVGDRNAIRKAMYAHHAAKKARVARKLYAPDDSYTQVGLNDDLGARAIFFHEDSHHRGHVLAGVSSAMRSVMTVEITVDGARRVVHDLCDWRLTRISDAPEDRYSPADYASFFAYGHWLRAVVETAISTGAAIPAMLGEWR